MYKHNNFNTLLADKLLVRDFIKEKIGKKYLIPLINHYDNFDDINFDSLPHKFVLKTNHGSGMNYICENKYNINYIDCKYKFEQWMNINPYYLSREKKYKNIKPKIICEKYLGKNIYDYKVFCFDGQPKYIQVDVDRFTNHKRVFYNVKWERQNFSIIYDESEKNIKKPRQLSELLKLSSILSSNLIFARTDFYIVQNQVFFGEITLHPEGGNCTVIPKSSDHLLAKEIQSFK